MGSRDNNVNYIYERYLKVNKNYEDDIKKETEKNPHDVSNTIMIFTGFVLAFLLGLTVAIII